MYSILALFGLAAVSTAGKCPPKNWFTDQASGKLQRNTMVGFVYVPPNYALEFDITPENTVSTWASIIHYTKDDKNNETPGSRAPAIWFYPNDTRLHIRFGGETFKNQGIRTRPLPLRQRTSVRIEARGPSVIAYLNGTFGGYYHAPSQRVYGNSTFYLSDPWYPPADAVVQNVKLSSIDRITSKTLASFTKVVSNPWRVAPNFDGKVVVPKNYALSFDITVNGTEPRWSSVMHFTKDGRNSGTRGSRMPAIFLRPNGTQLVISTDTMNRLNEAFQGPALAVKAKTQVTIEAIGRVVYLYYNNVLTTMMVTSGERIVGDALVFISDPWHLPANAHLGGYELKEITVARHQPPSVTTDFRLARGYYGKAVMPDNYELSFDIVPLAGTEQKGNLFHYTKDGSNSPTNKGSRMPVVFLNAATNRLTIELDGELFVRESFTTPPLPLNTKTSVALEIIDLQMAVYFNNTFAGMKFYPSRRIVGDAHLFVTNPFNPPANAILGKLRVRPITSARSSDLLRRLPEDRQLSSQYIGMVNVPPNFAISFDIIPRGIHPKTTSVVHLSKDGKNSGSPGCKMPAIYLSKGSTRLIVRTDGQTFTNEGLTTRFSLPLNQRTNVFVEFVGTRMLVYFNSSLAGFKLFPSARISGTAHLFLSSPFNPPANAVVGMLKIEAITQSRSDGLLSRLPEDRQLTSQYIGRVNVPPNYALSFEIVPQRIAVVSASIIHFSKDGSSGSRLPALWFSVNSTRLSIRVDGQTFQNEGLITSTSIPLNARTSVVVECLNDKMHVYFNGTYVAMKMFPSTRVSGDSHLFISNPYHPAATIILGKIKIEPITQFRDSDMLNRIGEERLLSPQYLGKVNVPPNYALSFDIIPRGVRNDWCNIIRYTKDGKDSDEAGSRMPGLWFTPNTTSISIQLDGETYKNAGTTTPVLPLNVRTSVLIECIDNLMIVYFNKTTVGMVTFPSPRITGEAFLYVSDPFKPPANAVIANLNMRAITQSRGIELLPQIGEQRQLSQVYYGKVSVPANYALSFDITPSATNPGWANILHYTKDMKNAGTPGSRMPAVWFIPGTTRLHIRQDLEQTWNDGMDTVAALPMNARTNVIIQCFDNVMVVYFNGTSVGIRLFSSPRISGEAHLFVSDPFHPAASAVLANYNMKAITQPRCAELLSQQVTPTQLGQDYCGRVNVPANYALSFDIVPNAVSSEWTSIAHYTRDMKDIGTLGSRMPGVWLIPGSTRLHIRLDLAQLQNDGIDTAAALPLNARTRVLIQSFDNVMVVYFNGTSVGIKLFSSPRVSGETFLFLSNPFYPAANALWANFNMRAISQPRGAELINQLNTFITLSQDYMGKMNVPPNYALTFDIVPRATNSDWSNVLHFTKDLNDMGTPGSRMPALWFIPGTTRLHIRLDSEQVLNDGIDTVAALPMNARTNVMVQCFENVMVVYFNGTSVGIKLFSSPRISGEAHLFVTNPFHLSANVQVANIVMKSISRPRCAELLPQQIIPTQLAQDYCGKVNVPQNYALSFDIVPRTPSADWTNVVHFTKDMKDMGTFGSRMPGVWLIPGSSRLHIRLDLEQLQNDGIDTAVALPVNARTNVVVECFGTLMVVYYNGTSVGTKVLSSTRIAGESHLFLSGPFHPAGNALLGNLKINAISQPRGTELLNGVIEERQLAQNYYGKVNVPRNYALSFDITPKGTSSELTNILHYTRDLKDVGTAGSRMPAVWFIPGTTRLQIRLDLEQLQNDGIDVADSLLMNVRTNVIIQCFDNVLDVYFNGVAVAIKLFTSPRISGEAHLFVSNSFHAPANALLAKLSLKTISQPRSAELLNRVTEPWQLAQDYFGKLNVPPNYALSFDIIPRATSSAWTNVLHFTMDMKDSGTFGSRIPGVWFIPGSTQLHIRLDLDGIQNDGLDTSALPMNTRTNVIIECFENAMVVYYNGNYVGMKFFTAQRIFGSAHLFVTNPFHPSANAQIANLNMRAITQSRGSELLPRLGDERVLSRFYYGKVNVPQDFVLTFDIVPRGVVAEFASIVHFSKDGTDSATPGSRMPALWFLNGTPQIRIRLGAENQADIGPTTSALPLNARTSVRLECIGSIIAVSLNNTLDRLLANPIPRRISGEAYLFMTSPFYPPANAVVSNMRLTESTKFRDDQYCSFSVDTQIRRFFMGTLYIPPNYTMKFDITPRAISSVTTNIVHVSKNGEDIMPGVWFDANTLNLLIRSSGQTYLNDGYNSLPIPLNIKTSVLVEFNATQMTVLFNGNLVGFYLFPSARIFGDGFLMLSNARPETPPANALISKFDITELSDSLVTRNVAALTTSVTLRPSYFGMVDVPADFVLSFDIIPRGTVPGWGSIIHYSKNLQGSRMPSVWFNVGTTQFHITTDIQTAADVRFYGDFVPLPMNARTTVTLEFIGRRMLVTFNGTLQQFREVPSPRISGSAHLTAGSPAAAGHGNPTVAPPNVALGRLQMTSYPGLATQLGIPPLSSTFQLTARYYGKVIVPPDFIMTFTITPRGIVDWWTSIVHFSSNDKDGLQGSRMPAIFFNPGTTQIAFRIDSATQRDYPFHVPTPLALNVASTIRLETFGTVVRVSVNGGAPINMTPPSTRVSGEAHLFVSCPWYPAANAVISGFTLVRK